MVPFVNNIKTCLILTALVVLLGLIGGAVWGTGGLVGGLVLAALLNFGAFFYSDKLAIAAMRGVEVNQQSAPLLYDTVRRLAARADLPMPRVYVCPQEAPNAFATGRSPKHAAVAVTSGALQLLDQRELEGVMAHELAHIRNRDTLTSTIAATVAGVFSMLAYSVMLFGGGSREGGGLGALLAIVMGFFGAGLLKAMLSRSREYVADADGAKIAGSPHGLVSALQKLDAYAGRIPMRNPNPAMNGMFIVEPFVGQLTKLFASHPPTEARVRALLS